MFADTSWVDVATPAGVFLADMAPILLFLVGTGFGLALFGLILRVLSASGSFSLRRGDGSSIRQVRNVGKGV